MLKQRHEIEVGCALTEAFTALVQNRFDHAAFNSLLDDIGEVLSIAEQLAPASGEE